MYWDDRTVLILGGTGSLGRLLIRELLKHDVHAIRVVARNEHEMFNLKLEYRDEPRLRYILADIRNKDRLKWIFKNVHVCINAAAYKHVSFAEDNPMENISVNVLGVQNAVECAIESNLDVFVQMSTDKAVMPKCVYGQTKALAESILLDVPNWQGFNRTKFVVMRSGNLLKSSGSVLEIWQKQKEQGKPLTITDPEATRYAAKGEDIARTIIDKIPSVKNGLYVLDMPQYKVYDLWLKHYPDTQIEVIGLQKGEKRHEILYTDDEKFELVKVMEDAL